MKSRILLGFARKVCHPRGNPGKIEEMRSRGVGFALGIGNL